MSHLFLNKDVYSCILDEQESVHVVKVLKAKTILAAISDETVQAIRSKQAARLVLAKVG